MFSVSWQVPSCPFPLFFPKLFEQNNPGIFTPNEVISISTRINDNSQIEFRPKKRIRNLSLKDFSWDFWWLDRLGGELIGGRYFLMREVQWGGVFWCI